MDHLTYEDLFRLSITFGFQNTEEFEGFALWQERKHQRQDKEQGAA